MVSFISMYHQTLVSLSRFSTNLKNVENYLYAYIWNAKNHCCIYLTGELDGVIYFDVSSNISEPW